MPRPAPRPAAAVVLMLALAVLLAACTGGDAGLPEVPAAEAAPSDGAAPLRVAACRPATLLPGDNLEVCGAEVLAQLFTPLVRYDLETGEPVMAAATSIESDDQRVWRIALRDDLAFHDGEPVTAASFADAWDLTVAQGLETATYLDRIAGWSAVASGEASSLAGVEVLGDHELQLTLDRPFSQLPLLLGFNPFFPLPASVLKAPDTAVDRVIGNGPYRVVDVAGGGMRLQLVEGHPDAPATAPRAVDYVWVADDVEGLEALRSGDVDVAAVPATEELGELETSLVSGDGVGLRYLAMPLTTPPYDDPRVRQALSLALDRRALAADVLGGVARPATGLIPPAAPGATEVACAVCTFDPQRARELAAEAELRGPLEVSGSGQLVEAVADQWEDTLEVEVAVTAQIPADLASGSATGPVMAGWFLDYLSPQNVLEPLFATGGAANHNGFSSTDVDALLAAAGTADDLGAAVAGYQQAEGLVLEQLPAIPLVFDRRLVVHGPRVAELVLDRLGQVSLRDLVAA